MTTTLLTPARRRGLEVLAATHPYSGRYSNVTEAGYRDLRVSLVYWQTADWLVAQQLAEELLVDGERLLNLTPAGILACEAAGIDVANEVRNA